MYSYEELSELARAKEDRRERLVSLIRGWLRKDRSPRMTVGLLFIPTALVVVGADVMLRRIGFELTPFRWAMAFFVAWPVFVLLLRWQASIESRDLNLDRLGLLYVRHDEGAEAVLKAPKTPAQLRLQEQIWRSISENIGRAAGNSGGGLPVTLLLAAVTLGCWTLWQLIKDGPNLLTGVILDGEVMPATPRMAMRISRENWFTNALGETYLFFLSLAFAAFVFGLTLPFFAAVRDYRKALHPPPQVQMVAKEKWGA